MQSKFILPAVAVIAVLVAGCGNQLNQAMPGETPASVNTATPAYRAAGGPLVPANDLSAGSTIPTTPAGGTGSGAYGTAGYSLVPPNSPGATPDAATTQSKQEKGGYFPTPDSPLAPR